MSRSTSISAAGTSMAPSVSRSNGTPAVSIRARRRATRSRFSAPARWVTSGR